jgi:hypothetical protein
MLTTQQISEILNLYSKFGWQLKKVLLTDRLKVSLGKDLKDLFGDTEIKPAKVDAVWFSRPSGTDSVAWELRRLSDTPFALFEAFDLDDDEETCEEVRAEMESRLMGILASGN